LTEGDAAAARSLLLLCGVLVAEWLCTCVRHEAFQVSVLKFKVYVGGARIPVDVCVRGGKGGGSLLSGWRSRNLLQTYSCPPPPHLATPPPSSGSDSYSHSYSNWSGYNCLTPRREPKEAHGADRGEWGEFYVDVSASMLTIDPPSPAVPTHLHPSFNRSPVVSCAV